MSGGTVPVLEVLEPGLLTTVQDAGRPRAARWGVPRGGAADGEALAVANLLLGNDPAAAVLEITLAGPTLRVLAPTTVALAGADLAGRVEPSGEPLEPGHAVRIGPGATLVLAGPAHDGLRACLAVPGGVAVTPVLGSASTVLRAGFGGLDGRPLRAGDIVAATSRGVPAPARWPGEAGAWGAPGAIRVVPGPHADGGDDPRVASLVDIAWTVGADSDRMGLRLTGEAALPAAHDAADLLTIGVTPGAVQLPPDGRPIVLLADAQPTGGYPVIAVVAAVDRPALARLRPGDRFRFVPVARAEAIGLLAARRRAFAEAAAHLRESHGWDEAWRSAR